MHAQSIGSPALISVLVSQHDQNEHPLELLHSFRETHAVSVHLQYKRLKDEIEQNRNRPAPGWPVLVKSLLY